MENKQRLLIAIVILASIKFILMPLLAYQNELVDKKEDIIKTNKKMSNMIAQGVLLEKQKGAIEQALTVLKTKVPNYQTEAEAKLDIQQRFENIAGKNAIEIETFAWESTRDHEQYTYIKQGKIELSIKADLINIIKGHQAISDLAPFITIEDMNTQFRWRRGELDYIMSRISLDVLFRVSEQ